MANVSKFRENHIAVYFEDFVNNNKGVVLEVIDVPPSEVPMDADVENAVRIRYRPMLSDRRQKMQKLAHLIPRLNKKQEVVTNTLYPAAAVTGPHKVKNGGPHSPDFVLRAMEDIYGRAPYRDEINMDIEEEISDLQAEMESAQVGQASAEADRIGASEARSRPPKRRKKSNDDDKGGGDDFWA